MITSAADFLKWLEVFRIKPGGGGPGTVDSITGTANQIIASSPTGNVVLSLPQDIAEISTPTFAGVIAGNLELSANILKALNHNGNLQLAANADGTIVIGSPQSVQAYFNNTISALDIVGQILPANINAGINMLSYNSDIPTFNMGNTLSTVQGVFSAVGNGDTLGSYTFWGDDGSKMVNSAFIEAVVSGSVSTGIVPTNLTFSVTNAAGTRIVPFVVNHTGNITSPYNIASTNFIPGFNPVTSSASTITLLSTSKYELYLTGTLAQTVVMPDTTTLIAGHPFLVVNKSSNTVTVNSSGGNLIISMAPNTQAIFTCILNSGATAASWNSFYINNAPGSINPGISITGTPVNPYLFTFYNTSAYQNGSLVTGLISATLIATTTDNSITAVNMSSVSNLSTTSWTQTWSALTSFTAANLVSVELSWNPSFPLLTSLSLPALLYFGGGFGPTLPLLTTLTMASLASVGGSFSAILASITSISLPALTVVGSNFSPSATLLTSFTANSLSNVGGNFAPTLPAMTSLSLPGLVTISGTLTPVATSLSTLSLAALVTIGSTFSPTLAALTTLTLTNLTTINGVFGLTAATLTTLSLPALTTCGGNFSPVCALATTVTLTNLQNITGTMAASFAALTALTLPALLTVTSTFQITAANLVTFSFNAGLLKIGGNLTMTGMKLNQASVDGILVSLANLNGTGGTTSYNSLTVNLSGGTSSTPSATGLAAKATLVGRSCTVTTN